MVAARRPEALPDGFAAELVSCVSGVGRRWGVTCPSRLTSPPETPSGESLFPSPLWAPVLRGAPRPLSSASRVFLVLIVRLSGRSQWKPLPHGTRSPHPRCWEGRGGAVGPQPPGSSASRGFPDAPGRASERCKVLPSWPAPRAAASGGSTGGAVLPALHVSPVGCAACLGICPNKQDGQVLPNSVEAGEAGCGQPGTQ